MKQCKEGTHNFIRTPYSKWMCDAGSQLKSYKANTNANRHKTFLFISLNLIQDNFMFN